MSFDLSHSSERFNPLFIDTNVTAFSQKIECTVREYLGNKIWSLPFVINFLVGVEKKTLV